MPGEPARAFRQAAAQENHDRRRERADQHHPAPALDSERGRRHEDKGEKRYDRHAGEADRLIDRKRPPAHPLRREFAQVGADGDDLDAETDARDEPPEIEAEGVGLQRHHDVGRRIPEERPGEDRPPAVAVGEKAAKDRADEEAGEQSGDEARDAGRAKEAAGLGGQDAGFDQARRNIGGEEEVIELEEHAEAEQHDIGPDRARRRQPVDAGRDRSGAHGRRPAVVHGFSPLRTGVAPAALGRRLGARGRGGVKRENVGRH